MVYAHYMDGTESQTGCECSIMSSCHCSLFSYSFCICEVSKNMSGTPSLSNYVTNEEYMLPKFNIFKLLTFRCQNCVLCSVILTAQTSSSVGLKRIWRRIYTINLNTILVCWQSLTHSEGVFKLTSCSATGLAPGWSVWVGSKNKWRGGRSCFI